nr:hypothetical protein [uncultured Dyadobacter sp.]
MKESVSKFIQRYSKRAHLSAHTGPEHGHQNSLLHSCKWVAFFCVISLVSATCNPDASPTQEARQQILLVIGDDLSGTFQGHTHLSITLLDSILRMLEEEGSGAKIAYNAIGNPSRQSFLRCNLESRVGIDREAVLSVQAKQAIESDRIKKRNEQAIRSFLTSYKSLSSSRAHSQTDLNGFFVQASSFFAEPQFGTYRKMLLVNSDGLHDTAGQHRLDCSLPPDVEVYLCGWSQDAATCSGNQASKFEGVIGFHDYLTQNLTNHE